MLGQRVFAWARRTPYLADLPRDVAVLSFVAFAVALGYGIAAPALPVYARTFGVSAFVASTVISGFALMRLLSAGPVGPAGRPVRRAADHVDRHLGGGRLVAA